MNALADELRQGVAFVRDREDLARALAEKADVIRGQVYAWQPDAGYPARLVQALMPARDMHADELVMSVLDKLSSDPIVLDDGSRLNIQKSARSWAKQYAKAPGFDIPLT
ncbi:hypothetical protein [Nonomuraea sp. NPDC049480]|uniref:hypothetical protein n=1 Tax=Nonomuraea sp. NPDC049480 TaxID=3364353 RepID=UPI0037B166D9